MIKHLCQVLKADCHRSCRSQHPLCTSTPLLKTPQPHLSTEGLVSLCSRYLEQSKRQSPDQWEVRPAEHKCHFNKHWRWEGASRASECSPQEHHAVDSCRALSSWITNEEESHFRIGLSIMGGGTRKLASASWYSIESS